VSLLRHLLHSAFKSYSNSHHTGHGHRDSASRYNGHLEPADILFPVIRRFSGGGKKLVWTLAGLATFIILVFVGTVAALVPFISQAFDYLNQNGLKGVFDMLMGVLQRLWEGSGK
jgi:hypothetical protein